MNNPENFSNKLMSYTESKYIKKIENEDLKKLHLLKIYLDDIYYNTGESTFSDKNYDILKEVLERRDPGYTPPIGAKIRIHDNRAKRSNDVIPFILNVVKPAEKIKMPNYEYMLFLLF